MVGNTEVGIEMTIGKRHYPVLIASTQIKDFFGLKIEKPPSEFLPRMEAIASHFGSISVTTTVLAASCLALIILSKLQLHVLSDATLTNRTAMRLEGRLNGAALSVQNFVLGQNLNSDFHGLSFPSHFVDAAKLLDTTLPPDRDRDELDPRRIGTERRLGLAEPLGGQRARVRAVGVQETEDHDLATQRGETQVGAGEHVGEGEVRRRDGPEFGPFESRRHARRE